jgi:Domain of unknown function (DUF4440)
VAGQKYKIGELTMASGVEEVTAVAEKLRQLMIKPDRAGLEALIAKDVNYGHSNTRVHALDALLDDLSSGATVFVTMDITDQTVQVHGDVGVVRHKLYSKQNNGGKPSEIILSILQVWQERGGKWIMIARQATRVP